MSEQVKNPNTCEICKHFRLHYIKFGKSYREISYGYCVYPRLKKREKETAACQYFQERVQSK